MQLSAFAKINWDLKVLGRRADGFHELDMIMVNVSVADTLTFTAADTITLSCSDPALPCDDSNLVTKAAKALQAVSAVKTGVAIRLEKKIPAGGGMGGGSSDCAATLLGLNKFWKLNWPVEKLHPLAAQLGSDVAFFLYGGWKRCLGRGEIIEPLPGADELRAVKLFLIFPPLHVSTPAVYKSLRYPPFDPAAPKQTSADAAKHLSVMARALALNEPVKLGLRNDLTAAARAVEPKLVPIQDALERTYPDRWLMSGSGAVHFVVPAPAESPDRLRATLENVLPGTRVVEAQTISTAPQP